MEARIECATCHRVERWSTETPGTAPSHREVVLEGGSRRPATDPEHARASTALDCIEARARGVPCHVVGDCPACGQLLVTSAPEVPAVPVRIRTPKGELVVEGDAITGPSGPLAPEEARAFVTTAWPSHAGRELASQLVRLPLFGVVLTIAAAWLLGIGFLWIFVSALWNGGTPGL